MTALVERHDAAGVATLTLSRPAVLNALSAESFRELRAHAEVLATQTEQIGCVVMRGAGRAFCAGADLKAFKNRKPSDPDPTAFNRATLTVLATLPQPLIAAVHGHCLTGGLELALTADFIVAAADARFGDSHQRWGLHAGWGLTQRLPRRVGPSMAKEMMFSGREVLADEALKMGLATRVVPNEAFDTEVRALAEMIAAHPRHVARWVKRMIDGGQDLPLAQALQFESEHNPGRNSDLEQRLDREGF